MRRLVGMIALTAALALPFARADAQSPDSSSMRELPAGGLMILPDHPLLLDVYDLFISLSEIRAIYTVTNLAADPRTVTVTFPLPDIDTMALIDDSVTLPRLDAVNFVGAVYTVDGTAAEPRFQQRAVALGLDVTADLATHEIPLFPFRADLPERISKLPPAVATDFVQRGILRLDGDKLLPTWTLKSTAFWRQTFPANKSTVLTLTYAPVLGSGRPDASAIDFMSKIYCLDQDAETTVTRLATAPPSDGPPPLVWLGYALTHVPAWALPASRFRLRIAKPAPESLMLACRSDFKRIGPTVFEWTAKDFYPDDDIAVLFTR